MPLVIIIIVVSDEIVSDEIHIATLAWRRIVHTTFEPVEPGLDNMFTFLYTSI